MWLLVTLVLASLAGFYLAVRFDLLGVIIQPIVPYLRGTRLKYLSPTDPFFVTLRLGIFVGLALSLPFVGYHLTRLLRPLVGRGQRSYVTLLVAGALGLFVVGVVFCFLAVVPLMLRFTMNFQEQSLEQSITVTEYLSLVTHLVVAFGLAFQLPVVMLVATTLGIVTPDTMSAKRRHAALAAVVVGALLTPPDVASQVLMAGPLYLLYEVGVLVSRFAAARGFGGRPLLLEVPPR